MLGLSFKPETDDIRESPAKTIIPLLVENGASVNVYDPVAMENFKKEFPNINYFKLMERLCFKYRHLCYFNRLE